MARAKTDPSAPLQPIRQAARLTGLSEYSLRQGCKAGTVPFIREGCEYRIHVPLLLAQIEKAAASSMGRVSA